MGGWLITQDGTHGKIISVNRGNSTCLVKPVLWKSTESPPYASRNLWAIVEVQDPTLDPTIRDSWIPFLSPVSPVLSIATTQTTLDP